MLVRSHSLARVPRIKWPAGVFVTGRVYCANPHGEHRVLVFSPFLIPAWPRRERGEIARNADSTYLNITQPVNYTAAECSAAEQSFPNLPGPRGTQYRAFPSDNSNRSDRDRGFFSGSWTRAETIALALTCKLRYRDEWRR